MFEFRLWANATFVGATLRPEIVRNAVLMPATTYSILCRADINNGFSEHRSTSFNVGAYESAHPDLIGKFSSNDAFLTAYINTYKTTGAFLT